MRKDARGARAQPRTGLRVSFARDLESTAWQFLAARPEQCLYPGIYEHHGGPATRDDEKDEQMNEDCLDAGCEIFQLSRRIARDSSNVTSGGESRMIVLGEVPPSQPEQEQEPAQDVAAQWLQTEDPSTSSTTTTTVNATGANVPATASRSRANVPPVPQPRQRVNKLEIRVPGNRNRKSRRRRITVPGNHTIHLLFARRDW
ncbi:uncharacterized protein LOC143208448 [Lasioglossum baleicum]|uniref:uncharacterized protein LOC143208448 n=1 Tax=Lasioglossum baleicum TaxID=434251 RepID=UPI003FCE900A